MDIPYSSAYSKLTHLLVCIYTMAGSCVAVGGFSFKVNSCSGGAVGYTEYSSSTRKRLIMHHLPAWLTYIMPQCWLQSILDNIIGLQDLHRHTRANKKDRHIHRYIHAHVLTHTHPSIHPWIHACIYTSTHMPFVAVVRALVPVVQWPKRWLPYQSREFIQGLLLKPGSWNKFSYHRTNSYSYNNFAYLNTNNLRSH